MAVAGGDEFGGVGGVDWAGGGRAEESDGGGGLLS